MQLKANCLPIRARFIKYSKQRYSNEDRYTCPLYRVKEWIFGNNELILPGILNSTSPQFICRVARYLEILLNK